LDVQKSDNEVGSRERGAPVMAGVVSLTHVAPFGKLNKDE